MSSNPSPGYRLAVGAKDAAAMLGISPRTLWTLTNTGEIPCVRYGTNGRIIRYRVADLEAFLDDRLQRGANR